MSPGTVVTVFQLFVLTVQLIPFIRMEIGCVSVSVNATFAQEANGASKNCPPLDVYLVLLSVGFTRARKGVRSAAKLAVVIVASKFNFPFNSRTFSSVVSKPVPGW